MTGLLAVAAFVTPLAAAPSHFEYRVTWVACSFPGASKEAGCVAAAGEDVFTGWIDLPTGKACAFSGEASVLACC